jgi:hypothetical protein
MFSLFTENSVFQAIILNSWWKTKNRFPGRGSGCQLASELAG